MGLTHFGQVLNLKDFKGPVTLNKNDFLSNYMKYGSCEAGQLISDVVDSTTTNQYKVYGDRLYA